jgi:hypothetical protein
MCEVERVGDSDQGEPRVGLTGERVEIRNVCGLKMVDFV